jgi:lipoprotein-anchoring transpeptidase ErfK/SrfK
MGGKGRGWQRIGLRVALPLILAGLGPVVSFSWTFSQTAALPQVFGQPALAQAEKSNSGVSSEAEKMAALKQTNSRWIEVNIATQRLIAWEGNRPVYAVIVSTGTDEHPTLPGSFTIQSKHRTTRMQGEGYDVPDVPYTMYYYGGYAIHGAYWHRRFGTPMSHGCVNVAVNHAEWLFDWASVGTPVVVHF